MADLKLCRFQLSAGLFSRLWAKCLRTCRARMASKATPPVSVTRLWAPPLATTTSSVSVAPVPFISPLLPPILTDTFFFATTEYLVITPNQINASALLISFWRPDLSGGIFISVFIVCIVASNLCGVKFFGHVEFWMSFAKIVVLTAIILGGFIISLGGNPTGDRIGFRYWNEPGACEFVTVLGLRFQKRELTRVRGLKSSSTRLMVPRDASSAPGVSCR